MYQGELVCFYSNQQGPEHTQKLVHVTTSDLVTWSEPVDDAADEVFEARPGMTTIAHIESTDQYIMTYELCGTENCDVYYKVASSPLEFASVKGSPLQSNDSSSTAPDGSPYVMWTQHPQRSDGSGLIMVTASSEVALFINEDSADVKRSKMVDVGQRAGHSRELKTIDVEGEEKLMLSSGGLMKLSEENLVSC